MVVEEEVQKIMVHQVEVEGTLGEVAVSIHTKPEVEGVLIAVVRVVLV